MTSHLSATAGASRDGATVARHVARWLALAATPTFAVMALSTAMLGNGPADMLCGAGQGSLLGGMVPMYLLMSAFHSAAWLRLISERRGGNGAGITETAARRLRRTRPS
ncbi:hypothetical protein CO669_27900 [Bradyrhizobium sp. Y36]|uniref:hypothetical protein n=1 Tax=Bradyrhizobium sp. Y36 TaxID=2035447 RepID=UPI000BE81A55|nr:hypothetical protein [Bradyrhizobium sp. Y36]PDT87071.1 hypothetical protein CO669_27900 [Bradyrhizobium sp. Y36]